MDLCYSNLGGGTVGIARYGEVLQAARASVVNTVFAAIERYDHATAFEKSDVEQFLAILVAANVGNLTQGECDAIIAAWPETNA
jgi:hypothetical protein